MLEVILFLALNPFNAPELQTAQFKPCVWPNKCTEAPVLAQFKPCVWPNRCFQSAEVAPVIAQFKPCVWPNRCSVGTEA